jgi:hypothetical protein
LPDDDYSVILSEDSLITLRLRKIVPQKYDERWGIRGITEQDLINVSKVKIWNQEVSNRGWNVKVIDVKDIPNVSELCEVLAFVDDKGKIWMFLIK